MKYLFIVFNALALIIVAWVVIKLPGVAQPAGALAQRAAGGLSSVPVVDEQQRRSLAQARQAVAAINEFFTTTKAAGDADPLLAIARAPSPAPETSTNEVAESERVSHTRPLPMRDLTLVLDGQQRIAVINSRLHQVGDALPEGGRVLRIGNRSVVVRESNGRQRTLSLPAERTQLGTLRSPDSAPRVN